MTTPKNTICLWFDGAALDAATFYVNTFPDSAMGRVLRAPGDYPAGKEGDVLTVECTVAGVPCLAMNGGPGVPHGMAFSFQIATDDQAETDRLWNAILDHGGEASACGWCKDRWGLSWQITPPRPHRSPGRPRPGRGQARVQRHDGHGEDRHRGDRGGAKGVRRSAMPSAPLAGVSPWKGRACWHQTAGRVAAVRRRSASPDAPAPSATRRW